MGNGAGFHDGHDKIIDDGDKETGKDNTVHASPVSAKCRLDSWPLCYFGLDMYTTFSRFEALLAEIMATWCLHNKNVFIR
jgi:hypothetical protein